MLKEFAKDNGEDIENSISDMADVDSVARYKGIRSITINCEINPDWSVGFCKCKYDIDLQTFFGNAIMATKKIRIKLLH